MNKIENNKKYIRQFTSLGLNIAYYRKKNGMTQAQLANLINVNRSHISKIESPNLQTQISLDTLFDIAIALEVEVSKLFEER